MASIGTLAVNIVARTERFARGIKKSIAMAGGFKTAMVGVGAVTTAAIATTARLAGAHNELAKSMNASLAIMGDVSQTMRRDMVGAALEVSAATRFAAKDAAEAYFFLASAGMNAKQALEAMPQVAAFAQAGNFDLALATDLATDAQSALGLTSKDSAVNLKNLTRVTDSLIKANTLANASAQQFSEALTNKAGAALRLVNKDIEEGLAVLAAYADQGIKGAEAGTALGIVMRDLQTKALQNASAFRRNGIAVYDLWGNMRSLPDIIEDIEKRLDGMNDATAKATLLNLGFADKSVAYIQTLIGTSEKIRGYEEALRDAGGTTQDVAEKQLTPMEKLLAKINAKWEEMANAIGPAVDALADWSLGAIEAMEAGKGLFGSMGGGGKGKGWSLDNVIPFGDRLVGDAFKPLYDRIAKRGITETEPASPERLAELQRKAEMTDRQFALSKVHPQMNKFFEKLPENMTRGAARAGKKLTDLITEPAKSLAKSGQDLRNGYFQKLLSNFLYGSPAAAKAAEKNAAKEGKSTAHYRTINSALQYGTREAAVAGRQRSPMLSVAKDQLKVLRSIHADAKKKRPTVMLAELNLG